MEPHPLYTEDTDNVLEEAPPSPPPKEAKRSGSIIPELDALESVLQGFNQPGEEDKDLSDNSTEDVEE